MAEWIEYTQSWDDTDDAVWPVLALAASAESELLYAGDSSGRLSMYTLGGAGLPLNRHASVQCAQAPLQRVAALARGRVFVQSDDTVQVLTDGGRQAFKRTTLPNDGFTMAAVDASGAQAFVCTSAGAGSLLDLEAGRVVRRTLIEPSVGAAHFGDFLVLGTAGGEVVARDARAPKSMVWAASPLPGAVTDIAGHGMQIYVCRSRPSAGQLYQTEADPTVRVYNVRGGAQPVDSIECSGGAPAWLQVCGGALWIGHTSGYAEARQLSRLGDDEAGHLYIEPALDECAGVTGFAVSPSGQAALIADSEGVLHVWASSDRPQLSIDGRASDAVLPDEAAATGPVGGEGIDIGDESVPLSCVGMPATAERLLSFMDNDVRWDVGRPVNYVDPAILGSMQMMGAIGYAPNPRTRRRNQQPFGRQWRATWKQGTMYDDSELTQGVAKFRSQQRYGGRRAQPAGDGGPVRSNLVPTQLRQMQIEYSRFGVEDFDFSLYNSTRWSGLEGDMRNAYANALLQLLYFTPEFRALMLSHCASACAKPTCLSCQLGFLFRMLDTANGASCHAAMLLQVLEERPDASALALLEDQPGGLTGAAAAAGSGGSDSYAPLAQRLLRFVLEQANSECKHLDDVLAADADPGRRRIVERVFGVRQLTRLVCTACDTPQERESHVLSVDLDPPQGLAELDSVLAGGMASVARADALRSSKKASLPQLVERALAKSAKAKGWCAGCRKFQLLQTDKSVTGPPAGYMVLNFTGRAGPAAAAPVAD
ncbi:poly(A)-specific ribonuclease, partial [Coemansia spiralis]